MSAVLSSERHGAVRNGWGDEWKSLSVSVSSLILAALRVGMRSSKVNHWASNRPDDSRAKCFNFDVHKRGELRKCWTDSLLRLISSRDKFWVMPSPHNSSDVRLERSLDSPRACNANGSR